MGPDPAVTNPDLYTVVFENDRVRVLEYHDRPGDRTTPHGHPGQHHDHTELVPAPPLG